MSNEPLEIEKYNEWYIKILDEQNDKEEFLKINQFVKDFCLNNNIEKLKWNKKEFKFINWGETQLVFCFNNRWIKTICIINK